MNRTLIALALTAACLASFAQTGNTQPRREHAVGGAGTFSCAQYAGATHADSATFTAWIQGFLSGANSYRYIGQRKELLLLPEQKEIAAWVSTYCKGDRSKNVYQASIGLWKSIEDQSAPGNLEECRAVAARDAKTETGARALLADCAGRFSAASQSVPEISEQECLKRGWVYESARHIGPKCQEAVPEQICTDEHLAMNARVQSSKTVCERRGDSWSAKTKLCHPRGGGPAWLIECKKPVPAPP